MPDQLEDVCGYSFGEAVYPRQGRYGPIRRRYLMMILAFRGSARVICDGEESLVPENSCMCFRNDEALQFEYKGSQGAQIGWCEGAVTMAATAPKPARGADAWRGSSCARPVPITAKIRAFHAMGLDLGPGSDASLNRLRNSIGRTLFLACFHEGQNASQDRLVPLSVRRARAWLDENWASEVTNASLAQLVGVSPQHLVSAFRRHVGLTPIRYMWKRRSEEGRRLLLQTDLRVSEISYRCGYKNPFHFSRHVSECFGASPRELRLRGGYPEPSNVVEGSVNSGYSEIKGWMIRP